MLEKFNNSKHLSIYSRVSLLTIIELTTKICYRIATIFGNTLLINYGTKCLSTSICVYLVLLIMGAIQDLKHGYSYNTMFELLKKQSLFAHPMQN